MKVFRGTESGFFRNDGFYLGDLGRHFGDPGRLVTLATVGYRGKKRRVGFDEHAVERNLREHVADVAAP